MVAKTMIQAIWHADDLECYENKYYFQAVSFHDHSINLKVDAWKHLLIIADPFLEQGPAMICLSTDDFALLKNNRTGSIRGSFNPDYLEFKTGDQVIGLKWRESKPVSFASKRHENTNTAVLRSAVFSYKRIICKELLPSPAAVLFNLPGGDNYFRREINRYFPLLVDALLLGREQEFLTVSRKLIGLGQGLTPTGDDLIHGALAACSSFAYSDAFNEPLHNKFSRLTAKTNIFGRHMLELGIQGLTPLAVKSFIDSIAEGRPSDKILNRVTAIGSSSGYEIAIAILCFAEKFIYLR